MLTIHRVSITKDRIAMDMTGSSNWWEKFEAARKGADFELRPRLKSEERKYIRVAHSVVVRMYEDHKDDDDLDWFTWCERIKDEIGVST